MISKVVLLCAFVASSQATSLFGPSIVTQGHLNSRIISPGHFNSGIVSSGLLSSGIVSPGLLNSGIVAPGRDFNSVSQLSAPLAAAVPSTISTSSIVTNHGSTITDKKVIGTTGLLAGAPVVYSNGLVSNRYLGAATPLPYANGIVYPMGLKGTSLLAAPGVFKTILK